LVAPLAWRRQDWATVLIPFIHRDPPVWGQDAEEFRPDRFLPENSHGRAPHSYIPFGTGERACIGRQFALHEAVLVLARLVHRYDIAQGLPDKAGPKDTWCVNAHSRAHQECRGLKSLVDQLDAQSSSAQAIRVASTSTISRGSFVAPESLRQARG
jgi:hypothetical protein